jgi:sulfur transfer complex TusBCD TusB component (DsrH family)
LARLKAVVSQIKEGKATLLLEDGICLVLPLDKLPKKVCEGTFVTISIQIDHMTALLNRTSALQFLPKNKPGVA